MAPPAVTPSSPAGGAVLVYFTNAGLRASQRQRPFTPQRPHQRRTFFTCSLTTVSCGDAGTTTVTVTDELLDAGGGCGAVTVCVSVTV